MMLLISRFHCLRALTLGLMLLFLADHGKAQGLLRITEVMSNGDSGSRDWFELSNYGTAPVNLTDFRMDDNSFSFSASTLLNGITSIQPGEAVVFLESSNPTLHLDIFRTTWSLGSSVQIGNYTGVGASLSSGGDGVTVFGAGGTELPGPFNSLIRVSFGSAITGTTFFWTYNSGGESSSLSTGTLTSTLPNGTYTTWLNGSTTMRGTPGVLQSSSASLLNWRSGSGVWLNASGTDWREGVTPTAWEDNSMAIFGGTAGNVQVQDDVSVAQLVFNTAGYTLSGDGIVTTSTIASPVAGTTSINVELAGSQGLTVTSGGTIVLETPSTFTGDATVVGGTLEIGVDDVFADSVVIAAARLATMDFNGHRDTVGGIKGLGTITNFSSLTLSINNSSDLRLDGFLSGSGDVIIDSTGSGRQVFNTSPQTLSDFAVKDYTGKTIIRQGVLAINETAFPYLSEAIEIETGGQLVLTSDQGVYFADNPIVFLGGTLSQEASESINEILNPIHMATGQTGQILMVNDLTPNPSAPTTEQMVFAGPLTGGGQLTFTASNPTQDHSRVVFQNPSHSFAGSLLVGGGVEFSIEGNAASATVELAANSTLTGAGRVGRIQGSGLVSPGNSPGIFTATDLSPGALQFAFEFGQTGAPNFANGLQSGNDLLRLRDPDAPFLGSFSSLNTIQIFLGVSELLLGNEFQGGFFTDRLEDFLPQMQFAQFEYFVLGDGNGSHLFGNQTYYALVEFNTATGSSWDIELSTTGIQGAAFQGGSANGQILALNVIPEPGIAALLALAAIGWAWSRRAKTSRQ